MDIHVEYAELLKRINECRSELNELMLKASELEAQIKPEEGTAEPMHLDRDGCLYWDNLIVGQNE